MKIVFILIQLLIICLFYPKINIIYSQNIEHTCPIDRSNITGIMQWNDGWPFNVYNRATHAFDGSLNSWQVVDINGYYNSDIFAPIAGQIIYVKTTNSTFPGDKTIGIYGDDGLFYELTHMQEIFITNTQRVNVGQKIGRFVSKQEALTYNKICDLNQESTSRDCIKVHLHFAVYQGITYDHPYNDGGRTLQFLSNYCSIQRPRDTNPEFPQLPTINCARITGNPNIRRCFMEKISGDLNNDLSINTIDLIYLLQNWNSQPEFNINLLINILHNWTG